MKLTDPADPLAPADNFGQIVILAARNHRFLGLSRPEIGHLLGGLPPRRSEALAESTSLNCPTPGFVYTGGPGAFGGL